MLKVGITGGIGSGKSFVSEIFELLGVPVYNSDTRAKEILSEDPNVRNQIIGAFGIESYDTNAQLNRAHIASLVFANSELLEQLNAIVHPAVGVDFNKWCDNQHGQPYVIKEAALIFEAGIHKLLDKVIFIFAPESLRIERVMARDHVDAESVKARIANQWKDEKKAPLSDFIVINDGTKPLLRQTIEIHNFLIQYARNPSK